MLQEAVDFLMIVKRIWQQDIQQWTKGTSESVSHFD